MNFEEYAFAILPGWLRGKWAERWIKSFGGYLHALQESAKLAVKARFPTYAPDDALPFIAKERGGLAKLPAESLGAWRTRLLRAWDRWGRAGTIVGLEAELQEYLDATYGAGYSPTIYTNDYVVDNFGGGMSSAADPDQWYSRFWVAFDPAPWIPLVMPFILGGATLGSSLGANELNLIKRIILQFKGAHSLPAEIFIVFSGGAITFASIAAPFTGDVLRIPFAKLLGYPSITLDTFAIGGFFVD